MPLTDEEQAYIDSYKHQKRMEEIEYINSHRNSQNPSPEVISKMRSFGLIYEKPRMIGNDYKIEGRFRERKKHYHAFEKYRFVEDWKHIPNLYFDDINKAQEVAKKFMLTWNSKERIRESLQHDLVYSKYGQRRPTLKILEVRPKPLYPGSKTYTLEERHKTVKIPIKILREKRNVIIDNKEFTLP